MDNDSKTTLTLEQAYRLYQAAKQERIAAIVAESDALKKLAEAAGSKTFHFQGQVLQVRVRPNKQLGEEMGYEDPHGYPLAFLCHWKKPPKETFAEKREQLFRLSESTVSAKLETVTSDSSQESSYKSDEPVPAAATSSSINASDLLGVVDDEDGAIVLE